MLLILMMMMMMMTISVNFIAFAFCKLLLCHDRIDMSPVLILLTSSFISCRTKNN